MKFSDVIKIEREKKSLTQQELADRLGFSKSRISMYESGNRVPSLDDLDAICDFFNVDTDYMLGKTPIRKAVTFDDFGNEYHYSSDEADKIAVYIHNNPELRVLLDAGAKLTKEDLDFVIKMAERMNNDE